MRFDVVVRERGAARARAVRMSRTDEVRHVSVGLLEAGEDAGGQSREEVSSLLGGRKDGDEFEDRNGMCMMCMMDGIRRKERQSDVEAREGGVFEEIEESTERIGCWIWNGEAKQVREGASDTDESSWRESVCYVNVASKEVDMGVDGVI